jgi:hypothetical protein
VNMIGVGGIKTDVVHVVPFKVLVCSGVYDASIDLMDVGGACRKDPTYGLFFDAPSLLPIRIEDAAVVVLLLSMTVGRCCCILPLTPPQLLVILVVAGCCKCKDS